MDGAEAPSSANGTTNSKEAEMVMRAPVGNRCLGKILFGIAMLVLIGLAPAPAEATHITCPSTVSGHVVFDSDVVCADNGGLTVGADGTTIDLNGFKLRCVGAGYKGSCQGPVLLAEPDVGVNTNGHSNVKINGGGNIDGFDRGVWVNGGAHVKVQKLNITGPDGMPGANPRPVSQGILVTGTACPGADIHLIGNAVRAHSEGIELNGTGCVDVKYNFVLDNNSDPSECHGIIANDSAGNKILNNLVTDNGEAIGGDGGITLQGQGSTDNAVAQNTVMFTNGTGIAIRFGASGNTVVNNLALYNSRGDLAEVAASGNTWNVNNDCETEVGTVPSNVCNPGEGEWWNH
jgi:hypothetical protein